MQDNQTYINLARKYRPQVIIDLIGQEALVKTLSNAFTLNRVAHAFMLTGVRGVGKTTTARIIAKALNCTGADGNGNITLNPCGVCESCVAISNDNNMDVIEMDAASRTGVDDVREIIENAKYKPVSSRYKIFIIDEVHMLSKNAFNALLKTLEEPPTHLKFIFATTEIRKVPITVLSRCQRFDLKRVSTAELSQHLAKICSSESISFDSESLFLLGKSANGSVRDSLSLLDQAIVYTDRNLTEEKIIQMLGFGAKEDVYNLFFSIISKDNQKTFDLLNSQYTKGIELDLLLEDILEVCHNASVVKVMGNTNFLDVSEVEKNKAIEIASNTDLASLLKLWQILIKGIKEVKDSGNSLMFANMVFTKMLLVSELGDVGKMIDFLKSQEKKNVVINAPVSSNNVNNTLINNPHNSSFVVPTITNPPMPIPTVVKSQPVNKPQNNNYFDDIPPAEMEDYGMPSPANSRNKTESSNLGNNVSIIDNLEKKEENETIKKEVLRLFPKATFVGSENITKIS
ncbi:MAG: DNA polymerase III subunit gamma/tau [Alphaproteobacteria bacterium]|jgi:DNA polymerase-3 subunit gamma/tau|nr:DNA polymerase III subunit gamma/tau [Alphaproteobacteria bacterium]